MSLADATFSDHALTEMAKRAISLEEVQAVLASPEQVIQVRLGRIVAQSRIQPTGTGAVALLRVFIDVDRAPPTVVTAYRTSKIAKYWRLS